MKVVGNIIDEVALNGAKCKTSIHVANPKVWDKVAAAAAVVAFCGEEWD